MCEIFRGGLKALYLKHEEWNINYGEMNEETHCLLRRETTVSLAAFG